MATLSSASVMNEPSAGSWKMRPGPPGRLCWTSRRLPAAGNFFLSMVQRREAGEPVQYVLGHWAFRQLDLMVDRRVLIPRPETEIVVEVALQELARLEVEAPVIVDLGTGSGAIALSIASERSRVVAWATDISRDALAVASANLAGLGAQTVGRVQLVQGNWWEALARAGSRDP